MLTADVVVIIAFILCIVLGSLLGFGRVLRFFSGGIFGMIISVVICYFLFGVVLSWEFVQELLLKFTDTLAEKDSWILNILIKIRIDLVVFAIVLFGVVQLIRTLVVNFVAEIFEAQNKFVSVINRLLGLIILTAFVIIFTLVAFQIIAWVSGTDGAFYQSLSGSVFKLDALFADNPLNAVFEHIGSTVSDGAAAA